MSRVAAAAKNSGWVFAGKGAERFIRIVVVIVLARALGVRGFGVYSFAFAFAEMFAIATDAGLHTILVREIARDREAAPRLLGSALILKGLLAILSWLAAWVVAVWTIPAGEPLWSALAASFLLFVSFRVTSFRMIFDAPFEAGLKMSTPIAIGVGSEFLSAACLIAAAWARWPIPALIGVQLAAFLPGFFLLARRSFREIRPVLRFNLTLWFRLLRMAIPVGIANFFLVAYTRTDILMLGWMMDEKSVGMYSAAFKLTGSLSIIPLAITTSLLPLLSNAFGSGDAEKVRQMYRAALSVAVVAGLPVAVGGYLLSEGAIGLIYGAGYEPAAKALQILAPAMFFSFILYVMTTSAVAVSRAGLFTIYAGMLALLNIALNAALIPSYGILGASWATLIAEGFLMAAGMAVLRPSVGLPAGGAAVRALGAALLAGAVLIWLPGPQLLRLFISAVLYVTLAYRGKGITSEGTAALEELLRSIFRPRPSESE